MKFKKPLLTIILGIFIISNVFCLQAASTSRAQDADNVSTTIKQDAPPVKSKKSIDWFQIIIVGSYALGVFVLFPLVVYTNLNEKLFDPKAGKPESIKIRSGQSEEERNQKAIEILENIETQLSTFTAENGTEMVTITKGKQAKFLKRGIDYINTRLSPTNPDVLARIEEFSAVYAERTKREFTGSKWIMGCAIGLLVFMGIVDRSLLLSSFTVIQLIGITFYYLSSRTPRYLLDKRLKRIGSMGSGVVGIIMTSLLAGMAAKHYVSVNGGSWQRDYGSELNGSVVVLLILFVAAMFVAFLIALFGVLNFALNYSTSFLNPLKTIDKWYDEDYAGQKQAA